MIFPTLTLSYQTAVSFSELGVATAFNQFCRSIGSTLGAALFGSLLIARFAPEVRAAAAPHSSLHNSRVAARAVPVTEPSPAARADRSE